MDCIIEHIIILSNTIFNELGSGFAECIYQKALFYELVEHNYIVEIEKIIPITYKNMNIGSGRVDLFIKNRNGFNLIIELKAISGPIGNKELTQLKTYSRNIDMECGGLIINFPQSGSKTHRDQIDFIKLDIL